MYKHNNSSLILKITVNNNILSYFLHKENTISSILQILIKNVSRETFYNNGDLLGFPACRGYCFPILFFLLKTANIRE